jgi:hypothetical protein
MSLLFAYAWLDRTIQDLSYNSFYMADSPYWLRIGSIYDWMLFGFVALTILVYIWVMFPRLIKRLQYRMHLS